MKVEKSGRTTCHTIDDIDLLDWKGRVRYDRGTALFHHQILILGEDFSAGGDSGSLVLEKGTEMAVGLLFAGSRNSTLCNPIGKVLDSLNLRWSTW